MISFSLAISVIAIVVSGLSFYFAHLRGPKFRIEVNSKYKSEEKTGPYYHYIITYNFGIINDGNKSGIIKRILIETDPQLESRNLHFKNKKIVQELNRNFEREVYISFPKAIPPKDSMIIDFNFELFRCNKDGSPLKEWPENLDIELKAEVFETHFFSIRKRTITIDTDSLDNFKIK